MKTKFTLFLFALFVFHVHSTAQTVIPTKGTDFWLGFFKNYEGVDENLGSYLRVFVVSDQNTSGVVQIPGLGWSEPFVVTANNTTSVDIPANLAEVLNSQVIEDRGINVVTQDTVAVYAISFVGFTADATKVLPTPTLGIEYIVSAYEGLDGYGSEMLIVATEDETEIEIIPACDVESGANAGVAFTISLDEGQTYMLRAVGVQDLTGTTVRGTESSGTCRPFAVFAGSGCSNAPSTCGACDHTYEQNFPTPLWGSEYYATPWVFFDNPGNQGTNETYGLRFLASVDNTVVDFDGTIINLDAGEYFTEYFVNGPKCINANNPITVTQIMQGGTCTADGDPSLLILDDVSKKIDNITFSTVESDVINDHKLNIIIDTEDLGTVSLDGVLLSETIFLPFENCNSQMWTSVNISEGSHVLSAPGGVTGYVYGFGSAESYAYSVGSFSPVPPIIIDDAICSNNQVILTMSQTYSDPTWYLYPDDENPVGTGYEFILTPPIQNGIYEGIGVLPASGCTESFFYSVESPEEIFYTISEDVTICRYQDTQLLAEGLPNPEAYTYTWSPAAGLSNPNISNPVASPSQTTTYVCTISTFSGCSTAEGSVTVTVNGGDLSGFGFEEDEISLCANEVDLDVSALEVVWQEDFDPNIDQALWQNVSGGSASAACGSSSGNGYYFNQAGARSVVTNPLDLSDGGTLNFDIKISNGSDGCDDAEFGDNVVVSYSANNGPWVVLSTLFEAGYPIFTSVELDIPIAAQTTNTRFRWAQVGTSNLNEDIWVLDNIFIATPLPTNAITVAWEPQNTVISAAGLGATIALEQDVTVFASYTFQNCNYVDSIFINVGEPFELDMLPDTSTCNADGIELYAIPSIEGDYTYSWTPAASLSIPFSATPSASPTTTTTYSVTVTSEEGCEEIGQVEIEILGLLDVDLIALPDEACPGEEIQLIGTIESPSNFTYQWTSPTPLASGNQLNNSTQIWTTSTYVLSATLTNGNCTVSDSVEVEVGNTFTVEILPDSVFECVLPGIPVSVQPSIQGSFIYSWLPASSVANASSPQTTITATDTFDLIAVVTDQQGCMARDTIEVVRKIEITDLIDSAHFCDDGFVILESGWPNSYSFLWSNGETTSVVEVDEPGLISVSVESPEGCVSSDEVEVRQFFSTPVSLGPDIELCDGEIAELSVPSIGNGVEWSNGSDEAEIEVNTTGDYWIIAEDTYCPSRDTINVFFHPIPQPIYFDTTTCFGYPDLELILDIRETENAIEWFDGSTESTIVVNEPGGYDLTLTSAFGCIGEHTIEVIEFCPGVIYIPNAFTPNNDGVNDFWFIEGESIVEFDLKVYNRWGALIYASNDIETPWLGQWRDGDTYVESDIYSYLITVRYLELDGNLSGYQEVQGHVTVIR